jgi:hypothetical protein
MLYWKMLQEFGRGRKAAIESERQKPAPIDTERAVLATGLGR